MPRSSKKTKSNDSENNGNDGSSSNFLKDLQTLFKTSNLYEILGFTSEKSVKDLTSAQLKKGYYKQSLKFHPDRFQSTSSGKENNDGDSTTRELMTKKFQCLSKVFSILNDVDKRNVYDESGVILDDSIDTSIFDAQKDEQEWIDYWRLLFKKVTNSDIEDFEKKYRFSDEESEDLKEAYETHMGDMDKIFDVMMCSNYDRDFQRFEDQISQWIKDGELKDYPKFTKESKKEKKVRGKKFAKEKDEAEQLAKDMGLGSSDNDLKAMIALRQQERQKCSSDFLDNLASKYSSKSKKKK